MSHSPAPQPYTPEPQPHAPESSASAPSVAAWKVAGKPLSPDRLPFPAHRIIGLADGVFAIVLTLLVLELRVPDRPPGLNHVTAHQGLLALLGTLKISLGWYIITGITVGSYWITHSRLMALAHHPDGRFANRNVRFLLAVSLLPFATLVLSRYPDDGTGVALYAGMQLSINVLLLLLLRGVEPDARAEGGDTPRALSINVYTAILAFTLMAIVAFWQPQYASWSLLVLLLRRNLLARLGVRGAQG